MSKQIRLGDVAVTVVFKDIKNVHLSVHPPEGKVRISAPFRMNLDTIRLFSISKLGWIRRQQKRLREQERETRREYLERESHYVWGRRYLLSVVEGDQSQGIELKHGRMLLTVRPGADVARKHDVLQEWYRDQIREATPPLIAIWEPRIGVKVERFFIQRMKTKWGGCNTRSGTIRLNTDLAKKPRECLEYLVVHEMVHLLEPTHNARFVEQMSRLLPHWRVCREQLNRLPVRHEEWSY